MTVQVYDNKSQNLRNPPRNVNQINEGETCGKENFFDRRNSRDIAA